MIEIGEMGNSGRAALQRILQEVEAAIGDSADLARCITEADTASGYMPGCQRQRWSIPGS